MAETGTDIQKARSILEAGGLVAIPTETVYGLAANALDPIAVARIFEVKQRPFFDPLIVHCHSLEKAREYVTNIPPVLEKLARLYMPGPLTLLLPKKSIIPDIVTAGLETVAIRIPDHPLTLELLSSLNFPLAAPSANPFGYISPTTAAHVEKQLGRQIDYILDGGPCRVGLESTIMGMENDVPVIYRLGGLPIEEIEKCIGKVRLAIHQSSDPKAPGQLKSHYAPRKPILLGDINTLAGENTDKRIAILAFGNHPLPAKVPAINLSAQGDLREAAANLFSMLRELDESDADIIIAGNVPDTGLGIAINDRLKRAAAGD